MSTTTMDEKRMMEASIILEELMGNSRPLGLPTYYFRKIRKIDDVTVDVMLYSNERKENIYYTIYLDSSMNEHQNVLYNSKKFEGMLRYPVRARSDLIYCSYITLNRNFDRLCEE